MENKVYKSCYWKLHGLEFSINSINDCCFEYLNWSIGNNSTRVVSDYKGEDLDIDEMFKRKKHFEELHKQNIYQPGCTNCIYLEESDWDQDLYIDHLMLNHWTQCNSNCSYCAPRKIHPNERNYYVLPILKKLYSKGMLRATKNSSISFGGGEPTVLEEFEELLDFFLDKGFYNIRINSSGIQYSKAIERGLSLGAVSLVVSPDAGTKETYEKIKNVPCFDKVWENLGKYAAAAKNNDQVKAKFILIPKTNTSKKEINAFFDKILQYNIKAMAISIEAGWNYDNSHLPNKRIITFIRYMEQKAKEYNLEVELYCEAIKMLQKREVTN